MIDDYRRSICITLLPEILQKLDENAKAAGLSRSRYIEIMIRNDKEVNDHGKE